MIILPDVYMFRHYGKSWLRKPMAKIAWLLQSIFFILFTLYLASVPDFIPSDIRIVEAYSILLSLIVFPKLLFSVSVLLVALVRRWIHIHRHLGEGLGLVLCVLCWTGSLYGFFVGPSKLEVRHVSLSFPDLPHAYDGYKIVQFTDAHVGTFYGHRRQWLQRDVDSINAQHPDLIVFTGDLQNLRPQEISPVLSMLASLKAKDGVYSVLGNHDYAYYVNVNQHEGEQQCALTRRMEHDAGWHLLLNEHRVLRRGRDSLVIAGEQNLEKPDSANFQRTMKGVLPGAFTILLQHNPKAWDRYIKDSGRVHLTLSGHVHGGQVALGPLRPSRLPYSQDYGVYRSGKRTLVVSSGIGGLLAFRLGMPPEIVVITLHKR